MSPQRLSYGEALAALARKGHFSDQSQTLALAKLMVDGIITVEQIEPLDIQ